MASTLRVVCPLDEWSDKVADLDHQGYDLVAAALQPAVPGRTEIDANGDRYTLGSAVPALYHLFFRLRS